MKPKTEFDIFCKLTMEQHDTYKVNNQFYKPYIAIDVANFLLKRCLDDARVGTKLAAIQALQVLRNLCNHPAAFLEVNSLSFLK
jgi:SNF2 family DNA or RNA helicase